MLDVQDDHVQRRYVTERAGFENRSETLPPRVAVISVPAEDKFRLADCRLSARISLNARVSVFAMRPT